MSDLNPVGAVMTDGNPTTGRSKSSLLGSGVAVACTFGLFLLMSHEGQLPHAVLLGLPLLAGVVLGLYAAMDLLNAAVDARTIRDTSFYPLPGESVWTAPCCTLPAAIIALAALGFTLGGHGLPIAIAVALALLFVSALRRPALLVFVIASAIYLPLLGSYGLWDPWETHYGEVSREILSRDDWISLWWAQDRWFWSKPILIFWAEALQWNAAGVGFHPDQHAAHTEWVLRMPIYLMSVSGLLAVYAGVAKLWSKRAGVLAAIVLATTPYYAFLTHQAITDMPFVANMTVAMMLLMLAFAEDPERRAPSLRFGRFGLSLQHIVIALIICITLPQVLYLASRNITFIRGLFAWHRDSFLAGSGGNPDVPGNFGLHDEQPAVRSLVFEPLGQALFWFAGLATIVWMLRREMRLSSLYMFAFYAFCALAFMAKGIPGFALPGLVAAFTLVATRRFQLLFDGRLRVAVGMLIVVVLGMPWFVAMFVRHGQPFTDRILIHDHIDRLTSGVHGDNGSIQYFIWQLGYGLFPLIGLAPAGLASWLSTTSRNSDDPISRARRDALYMLGLWFAVSFTLFSAMTTKFHHYIFPAVPPTAILMALVIDRMLPGRMFTLDRSGVLRSAAALLSPTLLLLGLGGLRGDVRGVVPASITGPEQSRWVLEHPWPLSICIVLIVLGVALFAWAVRSERSAQLSSAIPKSAGLAFGTAAVSGAVLLAFVGRDLSWNVKDAPPGGERLIHLFVYNYTRPWPDYLDYRAIMFGFASVGVLLTLACAVRALRGTAAAGLIGLALVFSAYCLDVYMIDLTPHWSQSGLIQRYYAQRKGPQEPLLAWQMNWKGENFYTGNRVYVFVELDNKALMDWVGKNKGRTVFLVLEHGRLDRLKHTLAPRKIQALSTLRDDNKFVLVRTTL